MNPPITSQWIPSARVHRFLQWSRNFLLVAGVLVLGYSGFVLLDAKIYQEIQARHFQKELENTRVLVGNTGGVAQRPFAFAEGSALGRIDIVRLGVTAMIMEGTDDRTLQRAVGHIRGTPMPGLDGNSAIAGHRDSFFRPLLNIRHNDEIILTTLNGPSRYLVDTTQVVAPEDIGVLDNSKGTVLTLVTCYPFYFVGSAPKRFIVRAHKIPG
jgi:sortase A